jgi:RNA polymerase sigma factor (sigma-70 family)
MSEVGPELLGRLLDEHGAALVLYARGWCDAPEDVVQEAFLKLVQQAALPENVVAWLYRVVRNGAISAGRSEQRRRQREAAVARLRPSAFVEVDGNEIDPATVTAALERLPQEQREVIVAHLWGGLSFEAIAALTACSSSTAHRRYMAGLTTLRERLGVPCPKKSSSNR